MNQDFRAAWSGAVAGAAATLPMSGVMLAAQAMGLVSREPPEIITEQASEAAGVRLSERASNVASSATHLGFGAIEGTVQGGGFRPCVFRLAGALGLGGFVRSGARGVVAEVEVSESEPSFGIRIVVGIRAR